MTRLLVIDDNRAIALGLKRHLDGVGYEVATASSGTGGLEAAHRIAPHLIVLDLMLPDITGFEVLRALRRDDATRTVPVLILTARTEELGALTGFRLGADDYVTKPFRLLELAARIGALLRRSGRASSADDNTRNLPDAFHCGTFDVYPARCEVRKGEALIPLRPKEYDLLIALLRRRGSVVSRSELLREVWGYDPMVVSRTVDTHIAELRRKVERDAAAPQHILTVRSRGYRIT